MKLLFVLIYSFFVLCAFSQKISFENTSIFKIPAISSASGIEFIGSNIYIISDDQTILFYTSDLKKINKYFIFKTNHNRIPKIYKPDFEAIGKVTVNKRIFLLIVSSGSQVGYRDTIYLYSVNKQKIVAKRNFRSVYDKMKKESAMNKNIITNIEAISSNDKYIYLFLHIYYY